MSLLTLIILLSFALRLIRLQFQPLWWDEGYSVYFARMSIPAMVEATSLDIHPPFYYALLHWWTSLVGAGPVPLRLFSAFVGVLTVPLFYAFARMLLGEDVATVAALLLAVSPFHVYYSQEVRMYGLVTLLGLASTYVLTGLLLPRPSPPAPRPSPHASRPLPHAPRPSPLSYIILLALALYTQYYAVFILIAHLLIIVAFWKRFGRKAMALALPLAAAAFYLPWVAYSGSRLASYIEDKKAIEQYPPLSLPYFLARHIATFGMGHLPPEREWLLWAGGTALAFLALAGLWRMRSRPFAFSLITAYLAVPLLGGFVVNLLYPFHPRYFERILLIALPPYLLLLAEGVRFLASRRGIRFVGERGIIVAALSLSALSLFYFYTIPRYPEDDYRPVARMIERLAGPDDVVLCIYPWQIGYLQSYCPESCPHPTPVASDEWDNEMRNQLDSLLERGVKIWFPAFQARGAILESHIEKYLLNRAYPVFNEWFGTTRLLLFAPPVEATFRPGKVRFGDWLELEGFALGDEAVESGYGVVRVELRWKKLKDSQGEWRVRLRLADAQGRTWAQRDSAPLGGSHPFQEWEPGEENPDPHGLPVPAGVPPGTYKLKLSVYEAGTETSLEAFDSAPPEPEPEYTLAAVRVLAPAKPPRLESLPVGERVMADLGGQALLVGYALPDKTYLTGDAITPILFWQCLGEMPADYVVFLQLQDDRRQVMAAAEAPPSYPTSRWTTGMLLQDPHRLVVPATLSPGRYNLIVGMYNPASGSRLKVVGGRNRGDDQVKLDEIIVRERPHSFLKPSPTFLVRAQFGDLARLIGYDLEGVEPGGQTYHPSEEGFLTARPGWEIRLTLYWQPVGTTDKSYAVFVHLVDQSGEARAFGDSLPAGGQSPTTSWVPGEYVTDTHVIRLGTYIPPGLYRIGVGFYEPPQGPRLPLIEGTKTSDDVFYLPLRVHLTSGDILAK